MKIKRNKLQVSDKHNQLGEWKQFQQSAVFQTLRHSLSPYLMASFHHGASHVVKADTKYSMHWHSPAPLLWIHSWILLLQSRTHKNMRPSLSSNNKSVHLLFAHTFRPSSSQQRASCGPKKSKLIALRITWLNISMKIASEIACALVQEDLEKTYCLQFVTYLDRMFKKAV